MFLGVILSKAQDNLIQINGSTNINSFKCTTGKVEAENEVYSFIGNQLPKIVLKVKDFNCGNGAMTKDFQKL